MRQECNCRIAHPKRQTNGRRRTPKRQHTLGVMRGEVVKFKFSFSIGLWYIDSFVFRNLAQTPRAEPFKISTVPNKIKQKTDQQI